MNLEVVYRQHNAVFSEINTFKDLQRAIKKRFKYILPRHILLTYLDNEGDRISITNTDDLLSLGENDILIQIEESDQLSGSDSEDSFGELKRSVKEEIQKLQDLSSSIFQRAQTGSHLVQVKQRDEKLQLREEKLQEIQECMKQITLEMSLIKKEQKPFKSISEEFKELADEIDQYEANILKDEGLLNFKMIQKENKAIIKSASKRFQTVLTQRFKQMEEQIEKNNNAEKKLKQLSKQLASLNEQERNLTEDVKVQQVKSIKQKKEEIEKELDIQFKEEIRLIKKLKQRETKIKKQIREEISTQKQIEIKEQDFVSSNNINVKIDNFDHDKLFLSRVERIGNIIPALDANSILYTYVSLNAEMSDDEIVLSLLEQLTK